MLNKEKKLKAFERALDVMDRLRAECPWNHARADQRFPQADDAGGSI